MTDVMSKTYETVARKNAFANTNATEVLPILLENIFLLSPNIEVGGKKRDKFQCLCITEAFVCD